MGNSIRLVLSMIAISLVSITLLSSTYTQTQISGQSIDMSEMDIDMMDQIRQMGGLQLVMPQAFAETDCGGLGSSGRNIVEFNLTGESVELPIMGGKTYNAMTFNGQVPGPTLRVTQGDVVKMTLSIPADEVTGHGNDMHASQISALAFDSVNPGETSQYCYIAESAGVFKYHCSGVHLIGMDQHVFSGMYGIAIVDPINGYKKLMVEKTQIDYVFTTVDVWDIDENGEFIESTEIIEEPGQLIIDRQFYDADALEFTLQFNQLYLTDDGNYDAGAMFAHQNTATVVNGMQFSYVPNEYHNFLVTGDANKNIFVAQPWNGLENKQFQSQLLYVENDQHVRLFVENHGNEIVSFHIVGEILDRVIQGNRIQSASTETWAIGGSQGAIIDIIFDNPGVYTMVNHDYAAIYTGGLGIFIAGDPYGLNDFFVNTHVVPQPVPSYAYIFGNPSDAVPPIGMNSISHPAINIHGLHTEDVNKKLLSKGDIELWSVLPTVINLHNAFYTGVDLTEHPTCNGKLVEIFAKGLFSNDITWGTPEDDVIMGSDLGDIINGLGGNDTICGGNGSDEINGGDGDDWLFGNGDSDLITGGSGNDHIFGGSSNGTSNSFLGHLNPTSFSSDRLYGNDGYDVIFGGSHSDYLKGGEGNDWLFGLGGNDQIFGESGNDIIVGGSGHDHNLEGGNGNDIIFGNGGYDVLIGGSGNDLLFGNDGPDSLHGQDGDDRLYGGDGDDWISGLDGNDHIWGGKGNDHLYGRDNNDRIKGNSGDDVLHSGSENLFGKDYLNGGSGKDHCYGNGGPSTNGDHHDKCELPSDLETSPVETGEGTRVSIINPNPYVIDIWKIVNTFDIEKIDSVDPNGGVVHFSLICNDSETLYSSVLVYCFASVNGFEKSNADCLREDALEQKTFTGECKDELEMIDWKLSE